MFNEGSPIKQYVFLIDRTFQVIILSINIGLFIKFHLPMLLSKQLYLTFQIVLTLTGVLAPYIINYILNGITHQLIFQ